MLNTQDVWKHFLTGSCPEFAWQKISKAKKVSYQWALTRDQPQHTWFGGKSNMNVTRNPGPPRCQLCPLCPLSGTFAAEFYYLILISAENCGIHFHWQKTLLADTTGFYSRSYVQQLQRGIGHGGVSLRWQSLRTSACPFPSCSLFNENFHLLSSRESPFVMTEHWPCFSTSLKA